MALVFKAPMAAVVKSCKSTVSMAVTCTVFNAEVILVVRNGACSVVRATN